MQTDEQLVGSVAEGDETALRELLRRYERPLSNFLHRQTGGRDVEDLYQETWLRVVRGATRFDPSKRFSTWLFQIAVNLCRDWHRRPPLEVHARPDDVADTHSTRTEDALDAARLLALLPETQREVIILRFYHDMSEEQAAAILDCPKGTVKSRMHHGLARLAAYVRAQKQ